MASTTNAALFGDSDSSDESVGAAKVAAPASDPAPANDNDNDNDSEGDEDANGDKPGANSASNANLFGDDDSSDDDEFDGDDGIVGRSAAGDGNKGTLEAEAVVAKPQTMSERLGLDSDSDDDKHESKTNQDGPQLPESKPVYVPPRKMELLDLAYETKLTPSIHIVKLPNLVGINYAAYNANTHNLEEEEEYYRGYVHNMIRWRYKYNPIDDTQLSRDGQGNPIRESNTRLVKWSDGTYTLHVGQEVLEVDNLDSSVPLDADDAGTALPGFAGINGYLYVSQKARVRPPSKKDMTDPDDNNDQTQHDSMEEDDNEDTPAQPAGTVLECLGPVASRFAPRPSSLASEAHRNLTLAVRQRNVKRARIAEIVTDFDPEKEKQARIKGKDDLAKSQTRGGGRRSGGGGGRRRGNESYRDEDGDYEGVNLGRLKRQTMRREYGNEEDDEVMDYGEDSDEEEDEWSKNKKRKRGVALQAARASSAKEKVHKKKGGVGNFDDDDESSEEGEVVFGEDDDEEEEGALFKKRTGGGAKKSDFLDDDDDDDE